MKEIVKIEIDNPVDLLCAMLEGVNRLEKMISDADDSYLSGLFIRERDALKKHVNDISLAVYNCKHYEEV